MMKKKGTKSSLARFVFGAFFFVMVLFTGVGNAIVGSWQVYAVPGDTTTSTTDETTPSNSEPAVNIDETTSPRVMDADDAEETTEDTAERTNSTSSATTEDCKSSLGALGWYVCPKTGKIAEAVDWLYDKIEDILVINPIEMEDGTPIYEIWKYCRGITNIVFIIFFLVVIYSQLTGIGISNYGIKKALPKMIVVAILVNLSFLICSLIVDISNIVGSSLRGVFSSVAESTATASGASAAMHLSMGDMFAAMAGGTGFAIGAAVIAFEIGAIWMLIPVVLGAIVAVVTGLITIALRQAVVALLIMISPLAIVAYMLPNTEGLFQKWKKLFTRMLVFYPLFSLLFGASQLAGFAIIVSATSGFGVLLGVAVQIFPLFFSWKLMQMSGTFLGDINSRLRGLASRPLASNRGWADSHRQLSRQRHLAAGKAYTPSLRLMQFISNRRVAREEEISEHATNVKLRGQAYNVRRKYSKNGVPRQGAMEDYEVQAQNMEYARIIERHKNNLNKGLGQLAAVTNIGGAKRAKLNELDVANVKASDSLFAEKMRGEKVEYDNAVGRHKRFEDAVNAHMDDVNGYKIDGKTGAKVRRGDYKTHFDSDISRAEARARYSALNRVMEGNVKDTQFIAAGAAQAYDTQKKIVETKMQKYLELTPPTKDVEHRLEEFTSVKGAANNIDSIIAGLRILNQRGDTDLVKKQIDNLLTKDIGGGVELGTYASQALASFLMFEVKDSDPWLRRFGKYINLETARAYNSNDRRVMGVTYDEYVRGYHDGETNVSKYPEGRMYAKKGMEELMQGTSLDNIERTALSNYDDSLIKAYTDKNGKLDFEGYLNKRQSIDTAIAPAFISANLKYLSGSEQIANAVKSKTGYGAVQKEDGTYEMKPIWENEKYQKLFAGHVDEMKKWYQDGTLKYLADQTPSQILGLRSDYRDPLAEHLENAYRDSKMEGWSDEAKAEHKEIMDEWAELQTKYGDLSTEEARENYNKEAAKLKKKMVGAQFRQVLDSKGKLNQIYRTRRSGAANNAKDWVREWLDLDNELKVTMKLEDDKRKLKAEQDKMRHEKGLKPMTSHPDEAGDEPSAGVIYSDVDRASFVNDVEDLWYNDRDEGDDVFYNDSLEYLDKSLGKNSWIAEQLKQFRKDDPYADSHMLKEYIVDLLNDPDNY